MPIPHSDPGRVAGRGLQLVEQLVHSREGAVGAVSDIGRLVTVGEDVAVERRQGDVDAGRAKIGHQEMAGVAAKGQLARWPPTGRVSEPRVAHQTEVDELTDALGDHRATESSSGHEF